MSPSSFPEPASIGAWLTPESTSTKLVTEFGMNAATAEFVAALAFSAPWALLARFDTLRHCIEASVCGVEVLRKRGRAEDWNDGEATEA